MIPTNVLFDLIYEVSTRLIPNLREQLAGISTNEEVEEEAEPLTMDLLDEMIEQTELQKVGA